jgi:hypothetical protein
MGSYSGEYSSFLLKVLHESVPRSVRKSAVRRAVRVSSEEGVSRRVEDCTYDTGASSGNYIGSKALQLLDNYEELQY